MGQVLADDDNKDLASRTLLPPFFLQHLLYPSSNLVNAERARGVPQVCV